MVLHLFLVFLPSIFFLGFHQSSMSVSPFVSTTKIRGTGARRPSLLQQSCLSFCHDGECPLTPEAVKPFNTGSPSTQHETSLSLKSSSDSQPFSSPGDLGETFSTGPCASVCVCGWCAGQWLPGFCYRFCYRYILQSGTAKFGYNICYYLFLLL